MSRTEGTLRGIGVSGAAFLTSKGVVAVTYLAIVSVLSPSQVGVITLGLAFYGILNLFRDFGLTPAIISRKTIDSEVLVSANSIRIVIACMIAVVGLGMSIAAPILFDQPTLRWILTVICFAIVVDALGFLSGCMLQRELRFKSLAVADIVSALSMALVTLTLAIMGFGALSLFVGIAASSSTRTAYLIASRPISVGIRLASIRDVSLISFGGRMAAAAAVVYLFMNLNAFVLGKVSITDLGFYGLAFLWATTPADISSATISRVLLPTFSELARTKGALFENYIKTMRYLFIVALGVFTVISVVSPSIISRLYGQDWRDSIPILEVLLLFGLARTVLEPAGCLLIAMGRPGVILATNTVNLAVVSVFVTVVAKTTGAIGCAVLLTVVYISHTALMWVILSRAFNRKVGTLVSGGLAPALCSLVALAIAASAQYIGAHWLLSAIGAIGAYLGLMMIIARSDTMRTIGYLAYAIGLRRKET